MPQSIIPALKKDERNEFSRNALRLLYVGSLSQRKGLSYLFRAVDAFKGKTRPSLTVIGRKVASCSILDQALRGWRWVESMPHPQILSEMERHDVLLFPSLFEGFGLVILEAMSRGMVVIATPHTAAIDLIEDGVNGFLVPIRSSAAIAERLERLRTEPRLREEMGRKAKETARRFTWESYCRNLVAAVQFALG